MNTLKDRLRQILLEGRVKSASAWSLAAGLTRVQVTQLLNRESTDDGVVSIAMIYALAEAAGVSPSWLAWGTGGPDDDPPLPTLLMRVARAPGLMATIERFPGRWRTSTIARATTETFQCDSEGVPMGGWEKALDSIESGLAMRTRGDAADVTRATARQVGRRPRLPKKP